MVFTAKGNRITLRRADGRTERLPDRNPLEGAARGARPVHAGRGAGAAALPGRGGGLLLLRHGPPRRAAAAHAKDDLRLPDAVFMLTDTLLVFDNLRHRLLVIANAHVEQDRSRPRSTAPTTRPRCKIGMLLAKLARPARPPAPLTAAADPQPLVALGEEGFTSTMDEATFMEAVRRAKEYIAAGDAYQVVLSRRLDTELEADPFTVYRALRTINPSPYLFFLRLGKTSIVGSSPEVLVRLEDDRVEERPIAGTHPRGADRGRGRTRWPTR